MFSRFEESRNVFNVSFLVFDLDFKRETFAFLESFVLDWKNLWTLHQIRQFFI